MSTQPTQPETAPENTVPSTWREWRAFAESNDHKLIHSWDTDPRKGPGNCFQRYPERASWVVGQRWQRPDGSQYVLEQSLSSWSSQFSEGDIEQRTDRERKQAESLSKAESLLGNVFLMFRDRFFRDVKVGATLSVYDYAIWESLEGSKYQQLLKWQTGKRVNRSHKVVECGLDHGVIRIHGRPGRVRVAETTASEG